MESYFDNIQNYNPQMWKLLPPGNLAICRYAVSFIPEGTRLASAAELFTANFGNPFPWGTMSTPESSKAAPLWYEKRLGVGGLYHKKWFVTSDGRFGGALNVPEKLPGALRCSFHYSGGFSTELADNEGYAIVTTVDPKNINLYKLIQMHVGKHVNADKGNVIVSPLKGETNKAFVGFTGRCMTCPNAEGISFPQLQEAVPKYELELYDEWKDWNPESSPHYQKLHQLEPVKA